MSSRCHCWLHRGSAPRSRLHQRLHPLLGRRAWVFAAAALALDASSAVAAPFAYVTNAFGPTVSVIDTSTNMVTTTINLPAGRVPFAVAMTPDLKKVYVTTDDALSTCGTAE